LPEVWGARPEPGTADSQASTLTMDSFEMRLGDVMADLYGLLMELHDEATDRG
jgi:hypothetical protein